MRATEFTNRQQSILEGKHQVQLDDLVLHVYEDGQDVDVRVMDGDRQVGYVIFLRDGKLLIPDDLFIDSEYRGRGVAKKIYDYVKSLGFKIIRSGIQTNMGKRFWDKNRGEHVDVWEEGVAEGWKEKTASAALAGSLALGSPAATADIGASVAKSLGRGAVAGVVGPQIYKEKNAADLAFAEKIPDETDKAEYLKAFERIKKFRTLSTTSPAGIGSNAFYERRFEKLKQNLEKKYNIQMPANEGVAEDWSEKYKKSINCKNPKGFSQRAHCQGRKKNNEQVELDERKRKRKKKTARYYYGPAYYFGATDTGAEGGDGGGLEEDWKKSLANVGLAGAIGLGAVGGLELKDKIKSVFTKPTAQTTQPVQAKSQQVQVSPITNNPLETYLMNVAKKSGLTGIELAQFLGQCAHETMDYKRMIERGAKKYFNKYEPKFAPGKAKLLGNVKPGDGERYKGRGYIQLTGRYNYKMAGKALNLPLEQNPELAAQPEIAAQIALWYWGQRVKSEVQDFADTTSVTRKINPGLSGLEDRHENFLSYIAQRDD